MVLMQRVRHGSLAATAACLMVVLAAGVADSASFTVTSGVDAVDVNPGNGVCETAGGPGVCSLRAAIQEANALAGGDVIHLPAGHWVLTIAGAGEDLGATGDLDVFDHLEIVGAGSSATVIDADGVDRVLHLHNINSLYPQPSVSISGVTLTGGIAPAMDSPVGGGLRAEQLDTLDLEDVAVTGNSANQGGGLWLSGGVVSLVSCNVSDNTALDLGVTNRYGDGLYAGTVDLEIRASSVTGNQGAHPASGAIHAHGCPSVAVVNSTVAGNTSGGVRSHNSDVEVIQSTIVDNGGNGVAFSSYDGTNTLLLATSIFAGNGVFSCSISSGVYTHEGNIDGGDSCSFDTGAGELVNTDPMLDPTAASCGSTVCFEPLPGSPAIDLLPITEPHIEWQDQRGTRRPLDGDWDGDERYDAGAVEARYLFADGFESGDDGAWSAVTP